MDQLKAHPFLGIPTLLKAKSGIAAEHQHLLVVAENPLTVTVVEANSGGLPRKQLSHFGEPVVSPAAVYLKDDIFSLYDAVSTPHDN